MADEKGKFEEDEYQFTEQNPPEQYANETAKLPNPADSGLRRVALVALGLVIVVFAVYKMLGMFFGGGIAKKPVSGMEMSQPLPMKQPPAPVTSSIEQQSLPLPVATTPNKEIESKLASLESQNQSTKNDVAQVNTNLASVNQSLLALNEKLGSLSDRLDKLSTEVMTQRSQMAGMKRTVRPTHRHIVSQGNSSYYLQAVVPGRAWIVNGAGKPMTVREGSMVPGRGRVKSIDPHQGLVIMLDGSMIRFNPEES